MPTYCEVAESVALATSFAQGETAIVAESVALASSGLLPPTFTPAAALGVAAASSDAAGVGLAVLASVAQAVSVVESSVRASLTAQSRAQATSAIVSFSSETALSRATATSEAQGDVETDVLASVGLAVSSAPASLVASPVATSVARAQSQAFAYLVGDALSTAVASDGASAQRTVLAVALDVAQAVSQADGSVRASVQALGSVARATSQAFGRLTTTAVAHDVALAESGLLLDALASERRAWVMNTETAAGWCYDGYDFESIAMADGRVLAVGPGGLYELVGDSDDGRAIQARLRGGFSDFGSPQAKHIEALYLAHTGPAALALTFETQGHAPATYRAEPRAAATPGNTRVLAGRGLRGRYWRIALANIDGQDFRVHDLQAALAVSKRRI